MDQSRYPLVRRWTPEEHEHLLAMAAAGSRPDEIARALGRTEPAVRGRRHSIASRDTEATQLRRWSMPFESPAVHLCEAFHCHDHHRDRRKPDGRHYQGHLKHRLYFSMSRSLRALGIW